MGEASRPTIAVVKEQGQVAVQRVADANVITLLNGSELMCEISSLHTNNPSKDAKLMLSDAIKVQRAPNKISKKAADRIFTFGFFEANINSIPAVRKIAKNIIPCAPAAALN